MTGPAQRSFLRGVPRLRQNALLLPPTRPSKPAGNCRAWRRKNDQLEGRAEASNVRHVVPGSDRGERDHLGFAVRTERRGAEQPAAPRYPSMAPLEQYLAKSPEDEIALARSAAPPSISDDAAVLVLGRHGYETAVKGKNEFVCFVYRSWASTFSDAGFWNPRTRSPNCFNAAAARTELPQYNEAHGVGARRATKEQMIEKNTIGVCGPQLQESRAGLLLLHAVEGRLPQRRGRRAVASARHVLRFHMARLQPGGAGLEGSPVLGQEGSETESTVLFIPVRRWSDGTPAPPAAAQHTHTK